MIVNRKTSHAALHLAGATLVRHLGGDRYKVSPDIDLDALPAAEEEIRRREEETEAELTLEERIAALEARVAAMENSHDRPRNDPKSA